MSKCPVCGLTLADPPNPPLEDGNSCPVLPEKPAPYRAEPITPEVARLGGSTCG